MLSIRACCLSLVIIKSLKQNFFILAVQWSIKLWDVTYSSKFDFRLNLLLNLEMNPTDAPKLFLECDFLRKHDKSDAFNWESVRKVVKWWDSWQSCVRLGKSWSVITNIHYINIWELTYQVIWWISNILQTKKMSFQEIKMLENSF